MRAIAAVVSSVLLISLFNQPALAERRVALVIGNSAYQKTTPLRNPTNDATAMSAMLKGAGFDIVDLKNDLKLDEMRSVLREFSDQTHDADIALVYFAGHGIEIGGVNYVIPVDAQLKRDIDVEDETVSLDRILALIEPARQLRLVILDACRVNPFLKTMKRTIASRAPGRGLAKVEPAMNTLVAFAAKAGTEADDGRGDHSPYTAAMLKHLFKRGLDLRKAFGFVRDDVLKSTQRNQEPYTYGSFGGEDIALVPGPILVTAPTNLAPDPNSAIRHDYELAERIGTKAAWNAFLSIYPDGYFADLARLQLEKLAAEEARTAAIEAARQATQEQARLAKENAKAAEQAAAAAAVAAAEQTRVTAEKKAAEIALRTKAAAAHKDNDDAGVVGQDRKPPRKPRAKSTAARRDSGEYASQGSGKISNGNCNCKNKCNAFAANGQLAGAKLAQCKSDCEQTFSGCIKGSTR